MMMEVASLDYYYRHTIFDIKGERLLPVEAILSPPAPLTLNCFLTPGFSFSSTYSTEYERRRQNFSPQNGLKYPLSTSFPILCGQAFNTATASARYAAVGHHSD